MNYAAMLGGIFVVHLLAMMSPGPNFLVVTQTAASRTRRAGVWTALGVAAAAAVWSSAALLGLHLLLAQQPWLQRAIEVFGGLYLLHLGIRLWRRAGQPPTPSTSVSASASASAAAPGDWVAFRTGFFTNLTNPKAIVFYASLFAAFLTPELPLWFELAAVGLIVVDAIGWHVALACLFSTRRAQQLYARLGRRIDRAAGGVLALLGLWLLAPTR